MSCLWLQTLGLCLSDPIFKMLIKSHFLWQGDLIINYLLMYPYLLALPRLLGLLMTEPYFALHSLAQCIAKKDTALLLWNLQRFLHPQGYFITNMLWLENFNPIPTTLTYQLNVYLKVFISWIRGCQLLVNRVSLRGPMIDIDSSIESRRCLQGHLPLWRWCCLFRKTIPTGGQALFILLKNKNKNHSTKFLQFTKLRKYLMFSYLLLHCIISSLALRLL